MADSSTADLSKGKRITGDDRTSLADELRERYAGAIVLVTHDEGAVHALRPDKVIILPDGTEDTWSEDFADLVSLA